MVKNVLSVTEKIKKEGKTLDDLDDLLVKALADNEEFERLEKSKWLRVDVVLKILEEQQQKLQQLADKFPVFVKGETDEERYCGFYQSPDETEEVIKILLAWKKKFDELCLDQKKEN